MSEHDRERLLIWLLDEQERRCAYRTRDGDGRSCDCKFGAATFGYRGEMTGCPELRTAIWLLRDADDASEQIPDAQTRESEKEAGRG